MGEARYHYRADITADALKVPETRVIADLLLQNIDGLRFVPLLSWCSCQQRTGSLKFVRHQVIPNIAIGPPDAILNRPQTLGRSR
jgi:hypothetical protein